jgi:RNA polymerase sigma factor (sigma-70 family)
MLIRIEALAEPAHTAARPTVTDRVAELYLAHREEIYRFLAAQGMPAATAQDMTQDVFVKLLITLRDGHTVTSEQNWLYRVASNRAVDYWRRERRFITVEIDADNAIAEALVSPEMHLTDRAARTQRMGHLAAALRALSKEQRACVLLRSKGLRYREIANILGVGVSTAADWLMAAVERLRSVVHE